MRESDPTAVRLGKAKEERSAGNDKKGKGRENGCVCVCLACRSWWSSPVSKASTGTAKTSIQAKYLEVPSDDSKGEVGTRHWSHCSFFTHNCAGLHLRGCTGVYTTKYTPVSILLKKERRSRPSMNIWGTSSNRTHKPSVHYFGLFS